MPYKSQIADLDDQINELRGALEALRRRRRNRAAVEKLLNQLAKLKAKRTRLMMRQSVVEITYYKAIP